MRFNFDAPLIAAFMDRWRPETHTFHLPVGEMTLSLEDAVMLGGLLCVGEAMGPIDIPATWQAGFLALSIFRYEYSVANNFMFHVLC
jgi:hypothetical protein